MIQKFDEESCFAKFYRWFLDLQKLSSVTQYFSIFARRTLYYALVKFFHGHCRVIYVRRKIVTNRFTGVNHVDRLRIKNRASLNILYTLLITVKDGMAVDKKKKKLL